MVGVYNSVGKQVKVLSDQDLPGGLHKVSWDGRNESGMECPAGVYIYRINAGQDQSSGTLIMMH